MSKIVEKAETWLTKHVGAVIIAIAVIIASSSALIMYTITLFEDRSIALDNRHFALLEKEESYIKRSVELEAKLKLVEERERGLQENIARHESSLRLFHNTKSLESQRSTLQKYVDEYLSKYSHVDFSKPVLCDNEKRDLRNKARALLNIISETANTNPLEFSYFKSFAKDRAGNMVVIEPVAYDCEAMKLMERRLSGGVTVPIQSDTSGASNDTTPQLD